MTEHRKRLSEIARDMHGAQMADSADPEILSVEYDSRRVKPGSLFVAIPGLKTDGSVFVRDAEVRGAAAVVLSHSLSETSPLPALYVPDARKALAEVAWALYGHPERSLTSVAVTGTNGKTTTAALLNEVLQAAGHKTGLIGTLGVFYGNTEVESPRTTPESSDLAPHFAAMHEQGFSHVVLEATSIGIDMERVWGIPFAAAIFTNLTRDHLDYHGTEEAYRNAKLRLFRELPLTSTALINADDPAARWFMEAASGKVLTYSLEREADFRATDLKLARDSIYFRLRYPGGRTDVRAPLIGRFNAYNLLAVLGGAYALGVSMETAARALEKANSVRGRAEVAPIIAPFTVVVDYAHTPDALEKILSTLRALKPTRLITVIGAGGDRDKGKRPLMAGVCVRHSDLVILTSDNPRSEDPEAILADMEAGLPRDVHHVHESDRRKAIEIALGEARAGDMVLVAGKGHETYQEIRGVKYPFDDREVVIETYRRLAG
jgi:UDP-N-acetylmuramoyl-L-alanyl-D-glutamate--2,6-diaminopimelate ligase